MITIFVFWILTATAVYMSGLAMISYFNSQSVSNVEVFFAGFTGLTLIASWLSLFMPVNLWTALVLIAISIIIVIFNYKNHRLRFYRPSLSWYEWLYVVVLPIPFLIGSADEISYADTGLYHAQAIKWIQEYAVVPGLGNLHGRFAFNSHFFLTSAMFSFKWYGSIIYPLNAVVLFVFLVYQFNWIKKTFNKENWNLFIVHAVLAVLLLVLLPAWIHTPSPDFISALLVLFTVMYFMQHWKTYTRFQIILLIALSATAATFKLSNLFLFAFPLIAFLNKRSIDKLKYSKELIIVLGVALAFMLPFFIRNVVLSGFVIYPYTIFDWFNVDWKIPEQYIQVERNIIEAYGKIHGGGDEVLQMKFSEWFPIWFKTKSVFFKLVLLSALTGIPATIISFSRKQWNYFIALCVNWMGLLMWFIAAPSPRFVLGSLFFVVAIGLAYLFEGFGKYLKHVAYGRIILGFLFISVFSVIAAEFDVKSRFENYWLLPEKFREPEYLGVINGFNFKYTISEHCWDADLPCAQKEVDVEMRGKTLQEGFRSHNLGPKNH